MMEMFLEFLIPQYFGVVLSEVFVCCNQKAASAAGRITHDIPRFRLYHFNHQPDDMTWCTELAVLPCSGDLAEHILVQVALCVPILHGHLVDHVNHLG